VKVPDHLSWSRRGHLLSSQVMSPADALSVRGLRFGVQGALSLQGLGTRWSHWLGIGAIGPGRLVNRSSMCLLVKGLGSGDQGALLARLASSWFRGDGLGPLGPLGCECAQHRPIPRPSLERICRKALGLMVESLGSGWILGCKVWSFGSIVGVGGC